MDDSHLLQRALDSHRSGNLREAAAGYQELLRADPDNLDALYLLGCLAYQTGNHLPANQLLLKAVNIAPNLPSYHNALGLTQMELQQYEQSAESFQRAIDLERTAEFLNNLGTLRKRQGRLSDAIDLYQQALEQDPGFVDAHYNIGNAYRAGNQPGQAVQSFLRAIEANPSHAHALAALGQTLRSLGRSAEAIPYLQRAVSLFANDAEVRCDLGDAFQDVGQFAEAVTVYRQACQLQPDLARPWYSAGCAENAGKETIPAIACFEKAVAAQPDWFEARHNLAKALFQIGQVSEALKHFRLCAAQEHKFASISRGMIAVIIPGVPEATNQDILEARREWAERDLPHSSPPDFSTRPGPENRPLRIGYISSFFHRQNWMKPVWGLINQHDRSHFEIHLFSESAAASVEHGYRRHGADHFHDITNLSNPAVAELIQQCSIDLLIDLNGYTSMRRLPLFAQRSAPVTIAWFNLYATTGMSNFDYLIGDHYVIHPEEEQLYSEKIVRVNGSYLTFEVNYPVPDVSDPPCLIHTGLTFGCFASQYKITNEVIAAWRRILRECPASSLLLKNIELGSAASREFLHASFERQGIPRNRILLEGPADHFQFLERYAAVDVALDTFPYNGGTTTTEAIWQGVPVLTFTGDRWASRTSASILRAAGLDDFVADNVDQYVALAIRLANSTDSIERLTDLRQNMRSQLVKSSVCDTYTFARQMEAIYIKAYQARP